MQKPGGSSSVSLREAAGGKGKTMGLCAWGMLGFSRGTERG